MSSFDASIHKLAGSSTEAGGLILKGDRTKKAIQPPSKDSDSIFKKPSMSMLGLDRLARKKREEREAEGVTNFSEKKPRVYEQFAQYEPDVRVSFGKSSRSSDAAKDRKYRESLVETPSYTGGVNEEALQKIHSRLVGRDPRTHGVYASTARDLDKKKDKQSR